MSLAALRALCLSANMAAHGMPVAVTVAGEDAVETTGIWMTPETEEVPAVLEFRRKDVFQVLVLSRADFESVPRGTVVVGAPPGGDQTKRWISDGQAKLATDRFYVALVPEPEA